MGAFKTLGTYSGTYNKQPVSATEPNDSTTYDFLTDQNAKRWIGGDVTTVGYYTKDYSFNDGGGDAAANVCDTNLNQSSANAPWAMDAVGCIRYDIGQYITSGVSPDGTTDDPIMHLACLFAWYIYDTYTLNRIPVEIVAHSMGGLITRAAIGGTSAKATAFPPAPLLVSRVVTVATPHGGIGGVEATGAWWGGQGTQEVADMEPGSGFMNTMSGSSYERPQGQGGTFWALIGSSVPSGPPQATTFQGQACSPIDPIGATWSLARALACLQRGTDEDRYPGGDGVVNALSQMAMRADVKVLYGAVEDFATSRLYVADTATEYEHESNFTCQTMPNGPPATCTQAPFYLNDGSTAAHTSAFVCASACDTTADFTDVNLAHPVPSFKHSLAEIASLLPAPAPALWKTGHAAHAGNDYPYETVGQFEHTGEGTDAWNEFYGQCDSFAAWKVYENLAGKTNTVQHPPGSIPAVGWQPANASISPVNQFAWAPAPGPSAGKYGNADVWAAKLSALGYTVDDVPTPGAVAWWPNAVPDPQDANPPDAVHGIASTGHVGYVTDVYSDGSVNIEQYNMRANGQYSVVHLKYNEGYTDNSFGQPNFSVPWPGGFIHVADGAGPSASPKEPADPGVVFADYPGAAGQAWPANYNDNVKGQPGLTVVGSADGRSDFTLAGSAYPNTVHGWRFDPGHGENGQMLWTNTHPGAADSTATWSPHLSPNTCYRIDAFVPDNWSNNAAALYTVTDQHFTTSLVPVDENTITNDWAELGVFEARRDGTLPVTLTDQGTANGQVAADAMRYIAQPGCSAAVRASQTVDAGNGLQLSGPWTAMPGGGQRGNERYTTTSGMAFTASAGWAATLIPNACYELYAYVPGNHSNTYQAMYTISTPQGAPTVSVDDNAYTNNLARLGTYRTWPDGTINVLLTNQDSHAGDFVAADTMSFVHVTCPPAVQGNTYTGLTIGPGSPLSQFSLASDWYNRFGHGDLGYEKWTNSHPGAAVSTAAWHFVVSFHSCYTVTAFIPDNYANNPSAYYWIATGLVLQPAVVNMATATGWTSLGWIATTTDNTITITLDDTGPAGTYTAADAIMLTPRTC